jgi:ABC-type Fe3+/spermidine/putrescine transport system ATPase subunit
LARDGAVETSTALAFDRIVKRFGSVAALNDVSFEVRQGEFLSLLGPSGSGKSTIQRLTGGFDTPDDGEIRIFGERVERLPAYLRSTTTVFQSGALFPHLTVFENVAFGLRVKRVSAAAINRRVRRSLDIVRLGGFDERLPAQLSGGQKQRVALARALVIEPSIVLFDEPLSALDLGLRLELRSEIRALHDEFRFTAVYVTHDQSEALAMSDRIAVLNAGRIEQIDHPAVVFKYPASEFTFRFLGESCSLEGTVEAQGIRLDGNVFVTPPSSHAAKPGPVRLYFRPSWLKLASASAACDTRIIGRFKLAEYLGESYRYHVEVGASILKIDQASLIDLQPGETVAIGWNASDAVVFQ